jgi:hypothetical protein
MAQWVRAGAAHRAISGRNTIQATGCQNMAIIGEILQWLVTTFRDRGIRVHDEATAGFVGDVVMTNIFYGGCGVRATLRKGAKKEESAHARRPGPANASRIRGVWVRTHLPRCVRCSVIGGRPLCLWMSGGTGTAPDCRGTCGAPGGRGFGGMGGRASSVRKRAGCSNR